ncbi:MAG: DUF3575 domain-containing protein [Marinifilaceae bacterium]
MKYLILNVLFAMSFLYVHATNNTLKQNKSLDLETKDIFKGNIVSSERLMTTKFLTSNGYKYLDDQSIRHNKLNDLGKTSDLFSINTNTSNSSSFSLHTNLLLWMVGAFNVGVEYFVSDKIGLQLNGGYAPKFNKNGDFSIGGWFISPIVKYYFQNRDGWYLSGSYLFSDYNIKLGKTGRQGHAMSVGVAGGYRLTLSQLLDMDFSLGLGYIHYKYDSYHHVEKNMNVYKHRNERKNGIIPAQLNVGLIWKIR